MNNRIIVTWRPYAGGAWRFRASHPTGVILDALAQVDWDYPDIVEWLRQKAYPAHWKTATCIRYAIEWLWKQEGEEITFDLETGHRRTGAWLDDAPLKFCPLLGEQIPSDLRVEAEGLEFFYAGRHFRPFTDRLAVDAWPSNTLWWLTPEGKVSPAYRKGSTRYFIADYEQTRRMYA